MLSPSTTKTSKTKAARHSTSPDYNFMAPLARRMAQIEDALMSEYSVWKGTPYRYGGESSSGIDCSALVQRVYRDGFSFDLPRTTAGQVLTGRRVERDQLKPGDLVFFKPYRGDRHVGIYIGDGRFMHASSSNGVRISELDNPYWQQHYWQSRRPLDGVNLAMLSR